MAAPRFTFCVSIACVCALLATQGAVAQPHQQQTRPHSGPGHSDAALPAPPALFTVRTSVVDADGTPVMLALRVGDSFTAAASRFCSGGAATAFLLERGMAFEACVAAAAADFEGQVTAWMRSYGDLVRGGKGAAVGGLQGMLPSLVGVMTSAERRCNRAASDNAILLQLDRKLDEVAVAVRARTCTSSSSSSAGQREHEPALAAAGAPSPALRVVLSPDTATPSADGSDSQRTHTATPWPLRPDSCSGLYHTLPQLALEPTDQQIPGHDPDGPGPDAPSPPMLRTINHRFDLPSLVNRLGLTGPAVEVGVHQGNFSQHFLAHWHSRTGVLHLVDAWGRLPGYDSDRQPDLQLTLQAVAPFPGRYVVHKGMSVVEAAKFPDGYFDFVYVDAQHSYAEALHDLIAWYPKLRVGGLMAGDDYYNGFVPQAGRVFGVRDAVDSFAALRATRVYSTRHDDCDGHCPNWYFLKCSK